MVRHAVFQTSECSSPTHPLKIIQRTQYNVRMSASAEICCFFGLQRESYQRGQKSNRGKTNRPNALSVTCDVTRTVCEYNAIATVICVRIKKK